jgi:hypothetical protein
MAGDEVAGVKSCVVAEHDLKVGQRVSLLNAEKNPQFGSVKFIGSVDGFQGIWVGVDWDSGQGRHKGEVDGVHYFDTSGDKSGSFVRPHTLSTGVSMLDALTCKYRASSTGNDAPGMLTNDQLTLSCYPVQFLPYEFCFFWSCLCYHIKLSYGKCCYPFKFT